MLIPAQYADQPDDALTLAVLAKALAHPARIAIVRMLEARQTCVGCDIVEEIGLATFLRCIELPEAMADWSLTSLQLKLIKIGARVVRHARAITFQLAEVAVTGPMVRAVLAAIRRLRTPPSCA